jgi:hypothetical protein
MEINFSLPDAAENYPRAEPPRTIDVMSAFENYRDELEKHEFMMGAPRGRLAVTMDIVTDAMALIGQHGVYCQSQRWPGKPVLDIQLVMKSLTEAKELISSVMEELKKQRDAAELKP